LANLIVRKALHTVIVLLLVAVGITFLIDLTPGDPAYAILGDQATPEQVAQVHHALHLDDSFYVRSSDWIWGLLHGDFGTSFLTNQSVLSRITQAAPVTAELIVAAFLMAIVVSVPAGVYSAYRAGGYFDRIWSMVTSALISLPAFVSALILVYVFALSLRNFPVHFPVTGWTDIKDGLGSNLWHVFLPALTLALVLIPAYSRLLRADMAATLQEDYILAARAKGLPTRQILIVHALRQSLFSLVTLAGLSIGQLISGAAIVEVIFALPGLGQLIVSSILAKDVVVVQGTVMFIALVYVLLNTAVDMTYSYIDPRVRLQRAR
jgi:peptide/nickel transport system permease protein